MLSFDADQTNTKALALYYSRQIGDEMLVKFMQGEMQPSSPEQALGIIRGFWQMTDLAVEDYQAEKAVEGIIDIEFWMYKLFIKVIGYLSKQGYGGLWNELQI